MTTDSERESSKPIKSKIGVKWVDWKPVSPNRLLHAHWSVPMRNAKAARLAWNSSSPFFPTGVVFWIPTIISGHSNRFGMELQKLSALTTAAWQCDGNITKSKPKGEKGLL